MLNHIFLSIVFGDLCPLFLSFLVIYSLIVYSPVCYWIHIPPFSISPVFPPCFVLQPFALDLDTPYSD